MSVEFRAQHPHWKKEFGVYQRDDKTYRRIMCKWKEDGIKHKYHATINIKTGGIYLDCRRRKIFAKHFTLTLIRPVHITAKTAWHASIIGPLAHELFKLKKGEQTKKEFGSNLFKSFQDIYRTPAYGAAMIAVSIAAIISGTVAPNSLYHTRAAVGSLERKMLRTEEIIGWSLSPCFSPVKNIEVYKDRNSLYKFARSQILFQRENRVPFNHCFKLFPQDQAYISPAA